jgi:hypothetical protein
MTLGEGTFIAGAGSQSASGNRWGDYSALTLDPTDDTTFWFTSEYYSTTASYNWRTRIGSFKLANRHADSNPNADADADPNRYTPRHYSDTYSNCDSTPTPTPTATPTPTPTELIVNVRSKGAYRHGIVWHRRVLYY